MKVLLSIQYDGKNYHGWQEQKTPDTVQGKLQKAIYDFSQEKVKLYVAGRTDSGVHALSQYAHFETNTKRDENSWLLGLNSLLPSDIRINFIKFMDSKFHARFSALSRTYRYVIYNHKIKPCLNRNKVGWYYLHHLDEKKMQVAAKNLIGEKDFSCFRSAHCQSKSPIKNINDIIITRENNFILIDVNANSFLYNMVRNIVGTLVMIGSGEKEVLWIKELLASKDRTKAGKQFPPEGLFLIDIEYDEKYNLNYKPKLQIIYE